MNPSRNQKNPETGGKKKTAAHPISFFRAWKYQRRTSPLNQNPSFQIAALKSLPVNPISSSTPHFWQKKVE
jgi:hypothetical protein